MLTQYGERESVVAVRFWLTTRNLDNIVLTVLRFHSLYVYCMFVDFHENRSAARQKNRLPVKEQEATTYFLTGKASLL